MAQRIRRSRRVLIVMGSLGVILAATLIITWTRPSPRIVIEPAMQDLGEMPQQHLELRYTVRNVGTAVLHIDDITTTCGCTKASVEQSDVAPGASTELRVTMDPQQDNLFGDLYRAIYLQSNDPTTPRAEAAFRVSIPKP